MCSKCKVNISYIECLGEIGLMILGRIRIQLRSWEPGSIASKA